MSQVEILDLDFGEEIPKLGFNKAKLASEFDRLLKCGSKKKITDTIKEMKTTIETSPNNHPWIADSFSKNGKVWWVDKEIFFNNLVQIAETHTLERIHYYISKVRDSITRIKTGKINDINMTRWKEYKYILTDSLWEIKKRDRLGKHHGKYWGNFVPQIPRQMMLRFTKAGEYVLDTFAGSGTTLLECRKLGRNGIGLELNPIVAEESEKIISAEDNPFNVKTDIIVANSVDADYKKILKEQNIKKIQLVVMHPPYYDIIRFSENQDDLSNAANVEDFLDRLQEIARRCHDVLERGRYACLVIGDKYNRGEWIPLGFWSMQRIMDIGFSLKSIICKNFDQTKGKRNQEELWRYRALMGGYYIFKHEYIFLFQKK